MAAFSSILLAYLACADYFNAEKALMSADLFKILSYRNGAALLLLLMRFWSRFFSAHLYFCAYAQITENRFSTLAKAFIKLNAY